MITTLVALSLVLPPYQIMTEIKEGFGLRFNQALSLPVSNGDAVFVMQDGVLHPGIWGWRGDKFVVVSDPTRPSRDFELNPQQVSCQVHVQHAPKEFLGDISFRTMVYAGRMTHGEASLYNSLSRDGESTYLNCMTSVSAAYDPIPLRVEDLKSAFGKSQLDVLDR